MFLYAMFAGVIGSIFTMIGKSSNSVGFTFSGALLCFLSAIMFFINAFI